MARPGKPHRKPIKIFNHDQRERAIRMVTDMLLQNAPKEGMRKIINEWATRERIEQNKKLPANRQVNTEVDMSRRTLESFILEAKKRIRKGYPRDPAEEAAEQLALLKSIQQHAFGQRTQQGMKMAMDAGRQITRLLGLDAPARSQSEVTVRQGQEKSSTGRPLAELIHEVMGNTSEPVSQAPAAPQARSTPARRKVPKRV